MAETKVSKKNKNDIQEIDLRSYNHSDAVGGYIRRKRSI